MSIGRLDLCKELEKILTFNRNNFSKFLLLISLLIMLELNKKRRVHLFVNMKSDIFKVKVL